MINSRLVSSGLLAGATLLASFATPPLSAADEPSSPSNERRELVSQRTESAQTFQNPDGSLTTEISSQPVRFRNDDGTWSTIDTTLVQRDGTWAPKASPDAMSFSNGGTAPFATLQRDGGDSLQLGWPGTLPKPTAEGNTLTYANVLPHADLTVTAVRGGFSHALVLREAPANDLTIKLPVITDGTTLAEKSDGGLKVTSNDDQPVQAPAPRMWDASTGPTGLPDNVEPVDATVSQTDGQTSLTLTPDEGMLSDPATDYPVTIDPTFTQDDPSSDTFVVSGGSYTNSNTNRSMDFFDTGHSNGLTARSFVKFPNFDYAGKQVTGAKLQARNVGSLACVNGATIPEAIATNWSETTLTWANQPSVVYNASPPQYYLPHGGPSGSSCTAHGWGEWNVTNQVQAWANGSRANYGFRLRAATETTSNSWRRWRSQEGSTVDAGTTYFAKLAITWVDRPASPSNLAVGPCSDCADSPEEVNSSTPIITAEVSSFRGGSARGDFEIFDETDGDAPVASGSSSYVPGSSPSPVSWTAPTLADGTYSVRSRTWDGVAFSEWTDREWFWVKTIPPVNDPAEPDVDQVLQQDLFIDLDGGEEMSPAELNDAEVEAETDLGVDVTVVEDVSELQDGVPDSGPNGDNGWIKPSGEPRPNPTRYTKIACNKYREFKDTRGKFAVQRRCGGSTAAWGFKLSKAWQQAVVGNVIEVGMSSWRNGSTTRQVQASHFVRPSYQLHGTFNPVYANDKITYYDDVSFRHRIAGGGNAKIAIYGNLQFLG